MIKNEFEKALDGRFPGLFDQPGDKLGEVVDFMEEYCRENGVELFEKELTHSVSSDLIEYYKRWKL